MILWIMVLTCIPMKLFENTELLVLDRDKPVAKNIILLLQVLMISFLKTVVSSKIQPVLVFVEYGGPSTLWSLLNWSTDDFFHLL